MTVAHYLAPEEFRGRQSASLPPCDLFSVGVVLYECLSGVLPWQAETPADLIQARRAGDAPRVVTQVLDCPVWLDVLVAKLLAVKRADRIATAEEAHRAIVTAKQKVAEGRGAVQQTLSGQKGVFQLSANRDELRKIRQDVRPRNREQSSLFEQTWFLAACLLAIVAGGVWAFLPPSEDQLFSKAQPFMESESPVDWKRAEEQYLKPLLARFPETKYAAEIQAFDDKYTMYRAETRARNNERLGRRAETEAERLYTEAWNFDKKGDRMTAWEKYDALVGLFQKSNDKWDRAFVSLARMRINQFKFNPGEGKSQKDFVAEQLEKAKQLQQSGELVAARGILDDLISSYGENQELQPLVDRARAQMQSLTAP
jgi:serine/threonine-protein kinase